ncbi:Lipid A biosynthesis lauroyl acyltransferase [hydrothermal vent metagenome]|uniref:Lipid A biosynthesis lauroyl acyltransferase n=1 Tax=hydrothermal vent metagenome TaxID=652676 RepID=A0A3B0VWX9_9ZZZZ
MNSKTNLINPRPAVIKYALSWIIYLKIWLIAQLPYKIIRLIGKGLGRVIQLLLVSRKKIVATNLKICFPKLDSTAIKQLSRRHFTELGLMIVQTIKAFFGSTTSIEQTAIIHGSQHLDACLAQQQGVLLVTGHFTALDMGAKILCKKYPIAGMYRPHKNPVVEYMVTKSRLKYAAKMFKRDELRPIIKHLKAGGILWYAPDQDYRRGRSEFVPFFGKIASTITATHQMARLSKCKVLFFHVQRNHKQPYYTLTISPPLADFPTKDAIADTARVNKGIEAMIANNPAEYLWVHKRFKTTAEGQKNPYES